MNDVTFVPINESSTKINTSIFRSRFVDELKKIGGIIKTKSRSLA